MDGNLHAVAELDLCFFGESVWNSLEAKSITEENEIFAETVSHCLLGGGGIQFRYQTYLAVIQARALYLWGRGYKGNLFDAEFIRNFDDIGWIGIGYQFRKGKFSFDEFDMRSNINGWFLKAGLKF